MCIPVMHIGKVPYKRPYPLSALIPHLKVVYESHRNHKTYVYMFITYLFICLHRVCYTVYTNLFSTIVYLMRVHVIV